jgi:hypothetical protein
MGDKQTRGREGKKKVVEAEGRWGLLQGQVVVGALRTEAERAVRESHFGLSIKERTGQPHDSIELSHHPFTWFLRRRLVGRGPFICVRSDANDLVRYTANPFCMRRHGCGMADSCRDGQCHFKAIRALCHILALRPSG